MSPSGARPSRRRRQVSVGRWARSRPISCLLAGVIGACGGAATTVLAAPGSQEPAETSGQRFGARVRIFDGDGTVMFASAHGNRPGHWRARVHCPRVLVPGTYRINAELRLQSGTHHIRYIARVTAAE